MSKAGKSPATMQHYYAQMQARTAGITKKKTRKGHPLVPKYLGYITIRSIWEALIKEELPLLLEQFEKDSIDLHKEAGEKFPKLKQTNGGNTSDPDVRSSWITTEELIKQIVDSLNLEEPASNNGALFSSPKMKLSAQQFMYEIMGVVQKQALLDYHTITRDTKRMTILPVHGYSQILTRHGMKHGVAITSVMKRIRTTMEAEMKTRKQLKSKENGTAFPGTKYQ